MVRADFTSFIDRKEFARRYDAAVRQLDSRDCCIEQVNRGSQRVDFWSPQSQWLRDAYHAERFAALTSARAVRLFEGSAPDFEVRYNGGLTLAVESTLADLPDRKIAEERRVWADAGRPLQADPVEDWKSRRNAVSSALAASISKKEKKYDEGAYSIGTILLIYLNLGTYDQWREEIERDIASTAALCNRKFRSIWVLWSGRLYRAWPCLSVGTGDTFRPGHHRLGQWREILSAKAALRNAYE